MRQIIFVLLALSLAPAVQAADTFAVDPVHSSVSFVVSHAGISFVHGRFNDFSGKFMIEKDDPAKSSFGLSINVDTVDTNNQKRDEHLRAPDFFDTKKFPTMSFQSTKCKKTDTGYEVTGNLTMHGVTRELSFQLKGGDKTVEVPKGTQRIGFATALSLKRSEFGLTTGLDSVGDEVQITIAVEAVKQ